MTFTQPQLDYLASQNLGRLATVHPATGMPQVSPVSFTVNIDTGTIDIGGRAMGTTRKFANVAATGKAALVVDDVLDATTWTVRGIEIRGTAEALSEVEPPAPYFSAEIIRIHPDRIIAWGLE
jgi:pyridoxamine 5'-phosphate oxidase family protein